MLALVIDSFDEEVEMRVLPLVSRNRSLQKNFLLQFE